VNLDLAGMAEVVRGALRLARFQRLDADSWRQAPHWRSLSAGYLNQGENVRFFLVEKNKDEGHKNKVLAKEGWSIAPKNPTSLAIGGTRGGTQLSVASSKILAVVQR
jgi:hypothetical protein